MRTHRLKTLATYFQLSAMGLKPYELRLNDRLYQQGDIVELYCIKKTKRGDIEYMRNDGVYINWPKYDPSETWRNPSLDMAMAGQHVPLDDMSPQSRAQMACIRATILFVLPGTDDIGMHSDHVVLTLQQIEYVGPTYLSGKPPTLFDAIHKPTLGQQLLPVPQGIVWNTDEHNFYNNLGTAMPNSFKHEWLARKDEFPQTSNPVFAKAEGISADTEKLQPQLEEIPEGVYYGEDGNNFYNIETSKGMGIEFWNKWKHRKDEFPKKVLEEKKKKTRDDETKLLKEATSAPIEGSPDPKGYKPKGFA